MRSDRALMTTPGDALSVKQAAEKLACSQDTVRNLCKAGLLRGSWRVGVGAKAYFRIPVAAIEGYQRCGGSFGTGGDGQPTSESTDDHDAPAWGPRLVRLQNDD
jgi:excisionase family DNA binding protein